jgi:hypothetical protein
LCRESKGRRKLKDVEVPPFPTANYDPLAVDAKKWPIMAIILAARAWFDAAHCRRSTTYSLLGACAIGYCGFFFPSKGDVMRIVTLVGALILCATPTAWAVDSELVRNEKRSAENLKGKEFVRFDGETLILAFEQKNDSGTIKEYIPEGESLHRWTKLAAVYEYPDLNDPQAVVDALVKRLNERNADIPFDVQTDSKTGAVIVDFIIWPKEAASPDVADFVEYNVFKYQPQVGGGLIAQQFAIRQYKDIPGFLAKMRPAKDRLMKEMIDEGLTMPSGKSVLVD